MGTLHLKGLNGLRSIAALSVVVFHLNMSFDKFNLPNLRTIDLAGFGVTIFFSISGFLITYLLLKEQKIHSIDVKNFYLRRILRIWPLYFLFLILSIVVGIYYNLGDYPGTLWYYIFLSANIPFVLGTALPLLGHFWSIGVEEQFYLFWPWIIKRKNNILKVVTYFTLFYFSLRIAARFIEYSSGEGLFYSFVHVMRFDCMSIGAIGAILVSNNNLSFFKIIQHPISQLLSWLVIVLLFFNCFHIASVIDHEITAIITVVLIVNLAFNPNTLINLDFPFIDFLGKISYGIYIIHQLVIFYYSRVLATYMMSPNLKYLVIYILVLTTTILLAFISYTFFEKPFLKIKRKFEIIKTSS